MKSLIIILAFLFVHSTYGETTVAPVKTCEDYLPAKVKFTANSRLSDLFFKFFSGQAAICFLKNAIINAFTRYKK